MNLFYFLNIFILLKPIFLFFDVNNIEPVNNAQNLNTSDLNKVYINNNLSSLEKITTNLHDNAWFSNINSLNYSVKYPTFCEFFITNLNIPIASKRLNKSSQFSVKLKQNLILNEWLRSIAELIILINTTGMKDNCNYKIDCSCISQQMNVSELNLIKFFINSLNGNFFKLKHLFSYLDEIIQYLTNEMEKNNYSEFKSDINNNDFIKFTIQELDNPFDASIRSLVILNEIRSFLNTPCALNAFKFAVIKNYSNKKLSIYSNISR